MKELSMELIEGKKLISSDMTLIVGDSFECSSIDISQDKEDIGMSFGGSWMLCF